MSLVNEFSVSGRYSNPGDSFRRDLDKFKYRLERLEREIKADAVPEVGDAHHERVSNLLAESIEFCGRFERENHDDADLVATVQQVFREETDRWFRHSWFAHRARTKPSGFPGDFEMLRMLYLEASPPTPSRGLGGYLDLCLMDSQLANAVRSRLEYAKKFLAEAVQARCGKIRILDIASGPCEEYANWPAYGDREIEIMAMDSDPLALDYVDSNIAQKLTTADLDCVRYNALRTRSATANRRRFGSFDIIYSVGLCDYLSDQHLIGMLSAWRDTLNDDGVVYVAFKDCERYDKTVYQWHLDWFFFQRTFEDMMNLYRAAGFDLDAMKIGRDDTGIIINFTYDLSDVRKKRIDSAQGVSSPHFDASVTSENSNL